MTKTEKIESFQIADNYNPKKGKFQQILAQNPNFSTIINFFKKKNMIK